MILLQNNLNFFLYGKFEQHGHKIEVKYTVNKGKHPRHQLLKRIEVNIQIERTENLLLATSLNGSNYNEN